MQIDIYDMQHMSVSMNGPLSYKNNLTDVWQLRNRLKQLRNGLVLEIPPSSTYNLYTHDTVDYKSSSSLLSVQL